MLKLKVTYFLTPEGFDYFPTWYEEVLKETSKRDGFVSMRRENEGKNIVVYLNFIHQEKLDLWTSTQLHDEFVAKIEPFLAQPEKVEMD